MELAWQAICAAISADNGTHAGVLTLEADEARLPVHAIGEDVLAGDAQLARDGHGQLAEAAGDEVHRDAARLQGADQLLYALRAI